MVFESKLDAIVNMIKIGDIREIDTNKLCSLIDTNVVKVPVNGTSLLSLLRKGLPLKGHDFKNVILRNDLNTLDNFIHCLTSKVVVELNAQSHSLLEFVTLNSSRQHILEYV